MSVNGFLQKRRGIGVTAEHRAVIEALGLSPSDLRELARRLERDRTVVRVREIAEAQIAALPRRHLYVTSLQRLASWGGGEDASMVRPEEIAVWAQRAGEVARASPNARHGVSAQEAFVLAARAAWARAVDDGFLDRNPAADVGLPDRPASPRTALSSDQLRHMHLSLVTRSRDPELDDLVWQLLRETACRRGGAIGLGRSGLATMTRTVRLTEKYGKERRIPVSAHLMDRLVTHHRLRDPDCERILHRADGGHLNDKWFDGFAARVQRLEWAAELGVTAHWVRHTTLTDVERLAGLRVTAAYAGHADTSVGVTGIYTKASPEELRLAHTRLFFDDPADADDPDVVPQLFRRVAPTAAYSVAFTGSERAGTAMAWDHDQSGDIWALSHSPVETPGEGQAPSSTAASRQPRS